ncbi:C40 family peptidase [Sulfitobacter albidus]|uniref:C40 family peptidase n=1 Tax=Sulfitobacter albidus TaxID=2829501 RepID=A0A975JDV5_9RHOB|nr:NlpC/P60 family protein [Sulfitobacter albidus]QUJ76436.1 C40 family peptidase [Sulfitobacter albidus]
MSDPRLTPDPARMMQSEPAQVCVPLTDLMRQPGGPRDRQLLLGADVTLMDAQGSWAYVQAQADGYCGYVERHHLAAALAITHRIIAPATHAYLDADIKSADRTSLSHGSRVAATGQSDGFIETAHGHIPRQHLAPVDSLHDDPAEVAALFIGTPYLWGGNSRWGIDCSGLVQAACAACGLICPGDSDLQEGALGSEVTDDSPPQRNDLLFWKGHVALVYDAQTLIHANAHAMATVFEPLQDAIDRIAQADGPVTSHRRLAVSPPRG